MKLVVYDLETTSLDTKEARILEFAAIEINTNKKLHLYINPQVYISQENSDIHGITNEVLIKKKADYSKPSLNFIKNWIDNLTKDKDENIVFIAHNNINYDRLVLDQEFKRHKVELPEKWRYFDTLQYARFSMPNLGRGKYSLSKLYEHLFSVQMKNAHSALYDADALSKIVIHLFKNLSLEQVTNILAINSRKAQRYENIEDIPIHHLRWVGPYLNDIFREQDIYNVSILYDQYKQLGKEDFLDYLQLIGIKYSDSRKNILESLIDVCKNYNTDVKENIKSLPPIDKLNII